ncbi:MAG: DNA polymerase III subunit gamma/tau, partial [Novosphingobium sp.]|nr:DNA polymerase III subunit gamma/tau [Novosphingobium sp.]
LSILDQAIAHADLDGDGRISAGQVRDMLGLADKGARRQLFTALLSGDGKALLALVAQQFALGVEPIGLMRGVMNLTHEVTIAQIDGNCVEAASAEEREAIESWAGKLTAGQLHRLWQLLLKGHEEVRTAPDPLVAAQMALLRVMHAADMPDPGKLAKRLEDIASHPVVASGSAPSPDGGSQPQAVASGPAPHWEELVERVDRAGELRVSQIMRDWVQVVSLGRGELIYAVAPGYPGDPSADLRDGLLKATGERWRVELTAGKGTPSLRELDEAKRTADADAMRRAPLVEATMAAFPGAEFVEEDQVSDAPRGRRNWRDRA